MTSKDYRHRAALCQLLAVRFTFPELRATFERLAAEHRDQAVTADLGEWRWSDNEPSE